MKITLNRKLELKSAVVYLRLQRENQRTEIREFLNSNIEFSNEIITERVKKYLRNIGIYREIGNKYELTPDGLMAKETGMVKEKEEGKYQIWFTQNDPLFGDRIFHFKRIKPKQDNSYLETLDVDFSGGTFFTFPIMRSDDPISEFSIDDTAKQYQGEKKRETKIDCTWTWNGIKNSSFTFSGKLETSNTNKEGKPWIDTINSAIPIDFKIALERHIKTILPTWNEETGRCKIKLENIENNDNYLYFEYTGERPREGYDSCFFEKLPLEPYNLDEAKIWRNKIISIELSRNYIHPEDFTGTFISANQKEGFSAYSDQLDSDIPDIKQYISDSKLDPAKKSDRGADFWHLTAPLDLNIGIPQILKMSDHFSLEKGGSISFRELAGKFGRVTANKVFYYDKYVYTYYQQRSAAALLNSFGVSDICIITDTTQQDFSNYLAKNKPAIVVEDIGSVYQNRKEAPHDRFIIFKHGGDLSVWTSTNSIDFIRFYINGEIQPDDTGNILKSVTFTRVKKNIFGPELENFIMRG